MISKPLKQICFTHVFLMMYIGAQNWEQESWTATSTLKSTPPVDGMYCLIICTFPRLDSECQVILGRELQSNLDNTSSHCSLTACPLALAKLWSIWSEAPLKPWKNHGERATSPASSWRLNIPSTRRKSNGLDQKLCSPKWELEEH